MIRSCPSCGRENRVPAHHLNDSGRCGACKAELGAVREPLDVTPAELDEIVRSSRVPVLVDFWAAWCGPCRRVAPEVAAVARSMAGAALVLKVDTDRHPELAARLGIRGIPTFIVFHHGRPVLCESGMRHRTELEHWLAAGDHAAERNAP